MKSSMASLALMSAVIGMGGGVVPPPLMRDMRSGLDEDLSGGRGGSDEVCPNCEGKGYLLGGSALDTAPPPRLDCGWCRGLKFDRNVWVTYHPHQQRPKAFIDIILEGGMEVECCWPNAYAWNPWLRYNRGKNVPSRITDEMVTHVRLSKRQPWNDPEEDDEPPRWDYVAAKEKKDKALAAAQAKRERKAAMKAVQVARSKGVVIGGIL